MYKVTTPTRDFWPIAARAQARDNGQMIRSPFTLQRNGWAGVVTWALVSGLTLYALNRAAEPMSRMLVPTLIIQIVYLVAMLVACRAPGTAGGRGLRRSALGVQLLAALVLGWMVPIEFLPIYTIIWMAILPHFVSARAGHLWLVIVMLAWYGIQRWSWQDEGALISVVLFGTFHYFALLSALEARRAELARQNAEALNRELLATQHLLSEATKHTERTRIARDLHDLLGHHLTALALNLQVAERVTTGEARERVEKCHALSRQMLGDVRATVSSIRDSSAVDFTKALRLIVENIAQLRIHLDIEDALNVDDVQVAEALLRCVQEAITNTLRHANASELFVRVWRADGRLHLQIRDNGRVREQWQVGNGLRGMRERIERIDGQLDIARHSDAMQIRVQIPLTS